MADHFISLNRGKQGFNAVDFTTGVATTAGDQIELRITDSVLTIKDMLVALEAFERFIEDSKKMVAAGVLPINS